MLVGREAEVSMLIALADGLQLGSGYTVVVTGEVGIGKSALLEELARHASTAARVVRVSGVQRESWVAYGSLFGLIRALDDQLGELSGASRAALESALAWREPTGTDRLAVAGATLSLLEAAGVGPIVVIVDDLQWIDHASRFVLLFAARRLGGDAVGFVLATNGTGVLSDDIAGLPVVALKGLDVDQAGELLSQSEFVVTPGVLRSVVEHTSGNPLALLTAIEEMDGAQRVGARQLGPFLPQAERIERVFSARMAAVSDGGRRAVTTASAEPSGSPLIISAALARLGIDSGSLDEAAKAGLLVTDGNRIAPTHPLLRAVALKTADGADLREIRRALSAELTAVGLVEEATWHLALGAEGPDETIAHALEVAGGRAAARGDLASAAATFERAAELSTERPALIRRLVSAGMAGVDARSDGDALLQRAQSLSESEGTASSEIITLRAVRANMCGDHALVTSLVAEHGVDLEARDPANAAALYASAGSAAWSLARFSDAAEFARKTIALLGSEGASGYSLLGPVVALAASVARGTPQPDLASPTLAAFYAGAPVALAAPLLYSLSIADQFEAAEQLYHDAMRRCRLEGATATTAWLDAMGALMFLRKGNFSAAYVAAWRALDLVDAVAGPYATAAVHATLAYLDAFVGDEASCRGHTEAVGRNVARTGTELALIDADYALALLELGQGRSMTAVHQLRRLADRLASRGFGGVGLFPVRADLVEALWLCERHDEARRVAAEVEEAARDDQSAGARVAATRALAVVGSGEACDRALAAAESHPSRLERGRTDLVVGRQWNRRGAAHQGAVFLRRAVDHFEAVGATIWSRTATAEASAAGERAPHTSMTAVLSTLTPQERQVAALAVTGATNRGMADELFVTTKTIESHLTSVYRKLGVRSKTQLAHFLATRSTASGHTPS